MEPAVRDKIPSNDQCYKLLKQYDVPGHIIRHSEVVRKVAVFLAENLNINGERLSLPEIEAAALLHDITKMEGIRRHQDHAQTSRKLLDELGFMRIGEIVGEHIKLQEVRNSEPLSEEEIINYSDKRVMHTQVVSIDERFADLRERYGTNRLDKNAIKRLLVLEYRTYELEKKIFSKLDFSPDYLGSHLK